MSIKSVMKVLLVGSGITGAASAAYLRQQLPKQASIHVWDKARGAGGRMSTSRSPNDPESTVDLGAQYISLTEEYRERRQHLYSELEKQQILGPLHGTIEGPNNFDQPGSKHYVAPNGVSSLVKYFLKQSDASVKYQHHITDVSFEEEGPVKVTANGSVSDSYDVVVLTLPVPQFLQLGGTIKSLLENQVDVKKNLEKVLYSSRFAMGLFFPPQTSLPIPWSAKYFSNDSCIRFMSVDNVKRGKVSTTSGPSMAVHTNVPYGLGHIDQDLDTVKEEMLTHIHTLLPDLPQPSSIKPQKWRYSQVHKAYEGCPGCVVVSTKPLIILAGDGFTKSTFDGCLDSAEAVVETVLKHLRSNTTTTSNI